MFSETIRPRALWFLVLPLVSACELQEVRIAEPEDQIVAEVTLRAGASTQQAFLHRTRGVTGVPETVDSAVIRVRHVSSGATLPYFPAPDTVCVAPRNDTPVGTRGSCYASLPNAMAIVPGQTYALEITLPDGRSLTGSTTVPGDFRLLNPSRIACNLLEFTLLEVRWTRAQGAWVYAAEVNLRNIRNALRPHNVTVDKDPLRLFGLSVSSADTTIMFPSEFGLFDRFDPDLTEALALLQSGLPRGVLADVVIAAADRNYVNWERGGNFNPSGVVRISSIRGDGMGVFGSMVPKFLLIQSAATAGEPTC